MKMAPGIIWGVLLVLIGLAAIFKVVFNVHLFGILFALFLIFLGITMLIGRPWMFHHQKGEHDTMFGEQRVTEQPRNNTDYNVIFGRSVYDLLQIL